MCLSLQAHLRLFRQYCCRHAVQLQPAAAVLAAAAPELLIWARHRGAAGVEASAGGQAGVREGPAALDRG